MVRLALLSDTHLPRFGTRLPASLLEALVEAAPDVVLHLGDHTAAFVVEQLAAVAPVEAVAGNNDPPELMARFGPKRIVQAGGLRVGMTHGHLGSGRTTPDRAATTFAADDVAVIAFGHSHVPLVEWRGDRLLVNPGSPTDRRRQPSPTFALLDVVPGDADSVSARIVVLPVQPPRSRRGPAIRGPEPA